MRQGFIIRQKFTFIDNSLQNTFYGYGEVCIIIDLCVSTKWIIKE